jgi:transcription termination factor Rho
VTDTIEAAADRKSAKGGLTGLKLAELKDVASGLGITGTAKMRKDDLVAAISARRGGGSSGGSGRSGADATAKAAAPARAAEPATTSDNGASGGPAASAEAGTGAARTRSGSRRARSGAGAPTNAPAGGAQASLPIGDGSAASGQQAPAERTDQGERAERPASTGASVEAERGPRERTERYTRTREGQAGDQQDRQGGQDRQQDRQGQQDRQQGGQDRQQDRQQGGQDRQQGGQYRQQGGQGGQQNQSRYDDDIDSRTGRRRNRQRSRDRKRGRGTMGMPMGGQEITEADVQIAEDDVIVPVAGILDVSDNYAFVRTSGYLPGPGDVYVPLGLVRRHGLRKGDAVTGAVKALREGEIPTGQSGNRAKFNPLVRLDTVNGMDPDQAKSRVEFSKLTPLYPQERLRLETLSNVITTRVVDLVSPIGKGQRGLIVSPPKAGKTLILQAIANAITTNNPEVHLMVVLVDERPEEVTDMQRTVRGEVIASTFDRPADDHTTVAELAIERAKRLVELGHDVVILLDGITRLGRAYNLAAPASGRILSGGVDSAALYPPKKFFGAARNIEDGGSLTILATALVETGSKMDEVIFEEFKGTGNWELKLSRQLANRRIYPAVDVNASGTRREDILMSTEELRIMWKLRRVLSALDETQGIELLLDRLKKTKSNLEFLVQVQRTSSIKLDGEEDN